MRRFVLALAVLACTTAAGGASKRQECHEACDVLVARCTASCSPYAISDAACRRGVLRRCRREGTQACLAASATTTTTTRTTTTVTTTTTLPLGGDHCLQPLALTIGQPVSGDTSSASDDAAASCLTNPNTPDLIYLVTPPTDGTLVLTLTADWDGGLHVRTTCDDQGSEVGCVDSGGGGQDEVLSIPVIGGTPYYVFVDAYAEDQSGPFTLTSALQ
jgi:hypothetical protein